MKTILNFISSFFTLLYIKRNGFNKQKYKSIYWINVFIWLLILPFKLLELLGVSLLINFIFRILTKNRKLTEFEKNEINSVFKDTVNLNQIRVNEHSKLAKWGAKNHGEKTLGFVFLRTVNFSRSIHTQQNKLDMEWLMHEIVHVAQFNKLGLQYVFEALVAQRIGGYDFGNLELVNQHDLNHYNLEQQADIIKSYYKNDNVQGSVLLKCENSLKKGEF